jgi:hypothetical protein
MTSDVRTGDVVRDAGILGIAAGIVTFVWPDVTLYTVSVLVAWT